MSLDADLARWREHLTRFAALLDAPPDRHAAPAPEAAPGHCLIFAPHPDDECIVGALPLRLKQEAFLVSASLQDLIARHLREGQPLDTLGQRNAIHLNDTHPALAGTDEITMPYITHCYRTRLL